MQYKCVWCAVGLADNACAEGCEPKAMSTLKIDIMQRITPLKLINEVSQCVNV